MLFGIKDLKAVLAAAGADTIDSLQVVAGAALAGQHYPQVSTSQPLLVTGLDSRELAGRASRVLQRAYAAEHPVTWLPDDGDDQAPMTTALAQLDRVAFADNDAAHGAGGRREREGAAFLFVPPIPDGSDYLALQEVVARLRAPGGCPWDQALTWEKLRGSLLEESYELLAALDAKDPAEVAEEQGDLMLQVALQGQIAVEEGLFRAPDVMRGIVTKLIRRHPHVFGDAQVSGTDEVLANWEAIKAAERAQGGEGERSPLAGIPTALPALAQADAYLDRMSRLGPIETPAAPWAELAGLAPGAQADTGMVGRALFGLVAWARAHGIDAESALRAANAQYAAEVARANT